MRNLMHKLSRLAAVAVLGSAVATAGDTGFDPQFKVRFGYGLGTKDQLANRNLGFGLDLGFVTGLGRFGAEIGYQYKPGDQFSYNLLAGNPTAPGNTVVILPAQTTPPVYTGDLRRNQLDGVTVRLSYEKSLNPDWAIRGGVQLGGAKFRHEYIGNIQGTVAIGAAAAVPFLDAYSGTPTKSTIAVSPFFGFSYKLGESSALEMQVLALRYQSISYRHVAGTAAGTIAVQNSRNGLDFFVENNRMVPHIEIGYAFRF